MINYAWVKRIKINALQPEIQDAIERTKIVIKTENNDWVDTNCPVIVPFSVHSAFHEGIKGKLKVHAYIKTLKEHVKNSITILFTEQAHINALSINFENDIEKTIDICTQDAHQLAEYFKEYMMGCDITFWDSFINKDPDYLHYKNLIDDCYQTDKQFQQLLYTDAENSYSQSTALKYPDKNLYIAKTIEDLREQCIYLFVTAKKDYRFEFYPGKPYLSSQYINQNLIPLENRLNRVVVNVRIE